MKKYADIGTSMGKVGLMGNSMRVRARARNELLERSFVPVPEN